MSTIQGRKKLLREGAWGAPGAPPFAALDFLLFIKTKGTDGKLEFLLIPSKLHSMYNIHKYYVFIYLLVIIYRLYVEIHMY